MKCASCGRDTPKTITGFKKDGTPVQGCPSCYDGTGEVDRDNNVFTGKKIWTGEQVYGRKKNRRLNHEWVDRLAANADKRARTRCPVRPAGTFARV
jgi:ribosome-binding protein aMBF1 (putative translation factor)